MIAERLLHLVPLALEPSQRFDLVKKLRSTHMHKAYKHVSCSPANWRNSVAPVVAELLALSASFRLPQNIIDRVRWLSGGDTDAAQKLLAAAEQEEAVGRLQYLESEFRRIDFLLQSIEASKRITHTIELPQGSIHVTIAEPSIGFWARVAQFFS